MHIDAEGRLENLVVALRLMSNITILTGFFCIYEVDVSLKETNVAGAMVNQQNSWHAPANSYGSK